MSADFAGEMAGLSGARHSRVRSSGSLSSSSPGRAMSSSSPLRGSSAALKPWQKPAFKAASSVREEEEQVEMGNNTISNEHYLSTDEGELTAEELEVIETPLSDLLPYEASAFSSQNSKQDNNVFSFGESSHHSYLADEKDKMPMGRQPSFGAEQVPPSPSSDRGNRVVGSSTSEFSGAVRSATDVTAPPSDDSSASTNPYHSDEDSENDDQGQEPQSPAPQSPHYSFESNHSSPIITQPVQAASPQRNQSESHAAPADNQRRTRGTPEQPASIHSNNRSPVRQEEGDESDSESYIPKALLVTEMKQAKAKSQQQSIPEQRPADSTYGPSADKDEDAPPPVQRPPTRSSESMPQLDIQQKKKKGIFGRSVSAGRPSAGSRSPGNRSASAGRSTPTRQSNAPPPLPEKQASRRSWFGPRRKKQTQSQALMVVSPDRSASSAGAGTSDHGSVSTMSLHRQKSTARLIHTLTNVPEAEVTPETAEQALVELEALQSELETLRSSRTAKDHSADVEQLRKELEAAQKAASQLELLNKNYRKAQKQMLQDLQDSQAELEKFQNARMPGSNSGDSQRLAQELASTTSELLALQEEHKVLVKRTSQRGLSDSDAYNTSDVDHETRLNLQKDLAQAMATISKFEEENTMILRRLTKLEGVEQRLAQVQAERDDYMSQLNDQNPAFLSGAPADAVAMISRLQKEKRHLSSREMVLKERIARLERKNENQKTIFQTAVEIKEVEMKITQKERDILAARVEEYQNAKGSQNAAESEEVESLRSRLITLEEQCRENEIFINDLNEKSDDLKQELEVKRKAVQLLEKQLLELKQEMDATVENSTAHLTQRISELEQDIESKQKEIGDLKERGQLESFKARRIMDDKVSQLQKQIDDFTKDLADRDEKIKTLEDEVKLRSSELQEQKKKAIRRQSPRPNGDGSEGSDGHSDRLTALRSRLGNYENVMRAKVASIRSMDAAASPPKDVQSQPALVVATPVSSENPATDEKYVEMETSLREHETKIKELEKELKQARSDLDDAQRDENKPPEESKEVEELLQSLRESDDRISVLHKQLAETRLRLAEVENAPAADSDSGKVDEARVEAEMEALLSQLSEKEETCLTLQKQVETLEQEKVEFSKKQETTVHELEEAQKKHETMEAQLLRVSEEISQRKDEPVETGSGSSDHERIAMLESELASASARLAEADSKIEMLEEFIQDDTQTLMNTSVASSAVEGTIDDATGVKESLQEKDAEIEELTSAAQLAKEQMERARSNVEELESEKTQMQAKLAQLSSLLEKRGKDEADMQLYKKCIEVAEVSAEKEELSQKLRMANAIIKRLEEEYGSNEIVPDPEERSTTSKRSTASTAQMSAKLAENELKIDEMREKLNAAEKEARLLREENEKANKSKKGGLSSDEEFMHKMRFLEEQNAAYAASLKALRIEIATRHVGTAFE